MRSGKNGQNTGRRTGNHEGIGMAISLADIPKAYSVGISAHKAILEHPLPVFD
jgi:hypothetical protein